MKVLSIECSAVPASVAVYDTECSKLLSEYYQNIGLTHSETLMPMVESCLNSANLSVDEVDCFSIAAGPGSFTGVRIGISTVKGLAAKNNTNTLGLSTLHSMAYNAIGFVGIIAAVMDARRSQCYTALFLSDGKKIERITDDTAISLEELRDIINKESTKRGLDVMVLGDGAQLYYNTYAAGDERVILAPPTIRYQTARSVALYTANKLKEGAHASPRDLMPIYLRLPQAERELNSKLQGKN